MHSAPLEPLQVYPHSSGAIQHKGDHTQADPQKRVLTWTIRFTAGFLRLNFSGEMLILDCVGTLLLSFVHTEGLFLPLPVGQSSCFWTKGVGRDA